MTEKNGSEHLPQSLLHAELQAEEKGALLKKGFRDSELLQELLRTVDVDCVNAIFSEKLRRSGIDPKTVPFITGERILVDSEYRQHSGAWYGNDAVIGIHPDIVSGKNRTGSLLPLLFHEWAHSFSHNSVETGPDGLITRRSGIGHTPHKEMGRKPYRLLNEGLTDSIAEEVFYEYVRRKGLKREDHAFPRSYLRERALLNDAIKQIAHICFPEMSQEAGEAIVRNGFEHAYFSGENLDTAQFVKLMVKTMGEQFHKKLKDRGSSRILLSQIAKIFKALMVATVSSTRR